MPQKPARLPAPEAPFFISPRARAYYQTTWDFDPVSDWIKIYDEVFQLETWFPLAADPGLAAAKIEIGAQVTVNTLVGFILNDLVFRGPDETGKYHIAGVECIHTIVYTGLLDDALEITDTPPEYLKRRRRHAWERRQHEIGARLPPWEHFAALKSYVASVAEAGIVNLLRASRARDPNAPEMLPFGFNGRMQVEIIRAIRRVSDKAGQALFRDYLMELLDTTPRKWFLSRLSYFEQKFFYDKETFEEIKLMLK